MLRTSLATGAPHIDPKHGRFLDRARSMIRTTWIYYPERDLFVEKLSMRVGKYDPSGRGRPTLLVRPRHVYGREVYEAPDKLWQDFLDGHPLALIALDAWIGHPTLAKVPSEGGLLDVDAFAVHDQEAVRTRYVG